MHAVPYDVISIVDQTFSFHSEAPEVSGGNYSLTIVQDSLVEYDEQFALAFSSTDTYVVLAARETIFTIVSDDRKC